MNLDIDKISTMARKYKKTIIVSLVAGALLLTLGIAMIGYVAYKTVAISTEKVSNILSTEKVTNVLTNNLPLVADVPLLQKSEEFMLQLTSGVIRGSLMNSNETSVLSALACFDAIGGPSPIAAIEYLKTNANDAAIARQLDSVSNVLNESKATLQQGPSACTNWLLNSFAG